MDYYAIINGQKKGPLDTIALIKQVRSGNIKPETEVSNSIDGQYAPAKDFPMLGEIFANQSFTDTAAPSYGKAKLSLGTSIKDGLDLWSRYALSFTIISAVILTITFSFSKTLLKISALADYPVIITYAVSLVTTFLYINFFGFILYAKRSQALNVGDIMAKIRSGIGATFLLAVILAIFPTANAFSPIIGIGAMVAFMVYATLGAFSPFLIFDKQLGMTKAYGQSSKNIRSGGSEAIGVVLTLVAINIIVAILPAIFFPDLFIFGLFISIPITVSSLAYIYDEVAA